MFRLNQWLRRSSRGSRRAARGRCPARLQVERLDDRILLSAPAVINYQVGSVTHENAFVTGNDGNLYLDYWNGAKWTWQNLGNGGQAGDFVTGVPAVINYQVGGVIHENVFVTGTGNKLYLDYWNGAKWTWQDLGNDGGALISDTTPTVINYQVGNVTHENVFVTGQNGNLYLDYWNGAKWSWQKLGDDGSALDEATPAVINYQVGSVTHENVFVTGDDGNLYLDYWNGAKWTWQSLGNDGVKGDQFTASDPAVINYQVGGVLHENVFVQGFNSGPGFGGPTNLYLDYWNGAKWTWVNLGTRAGPLDVSDPAVINYPVGAVTHENVFITGNGGNLYLDYWNGAKWTWVNLGIPAGALDFSSPPAVINYPVGAVTHENVFVTGQNGNLYLDYWNGAKWTWANLGNDGSSLAAVQGASARAAESLTGIPGPAVDLALGGSAPGLCLAVVADQGASLSEPVDSAIRDRVLLEDSQSAGTATNESARRSPAVLGPTNQPDLAVDLWSEDLARDPLDW